MEGSDVVAALTRREWLRRLADQTLATTKGWQAWPANDLMGDGRPEDASAAILTGAACRHEGGEVLDSIVAWLQTSHLLADPRQAVDVALASVKAYRQCELPADWWDAASLHVTLLAHWGASSNKPAPEVEGLVSDRFKFPIAARDITAMATLEEPPSLDDSISELAAGTPPFKRLVERIGGKVDREIQTLTELSLMNESVVAFARAARLLSIATAALANTTSEGTLAIERAELARVIDPLRAAVAQWVEVLTPLEVALARNIAKDEQVLRDAVAVTKRAHLITRVDAESGSGQGWVMSNGVSDELGEETFAADWLGRAIFSGGARSGLFEWGPSAYAWMALEPHDVEPMFPLAGLGLGIDENHLNMDFFVSLETANGPIAMDYRAGHSSETLRWLAMLILSRRLMFDVFLISGEGLHLGQRLSVPATEFVEQIRSDTIEALKRGNFNQIRLPDADELAVAGFLATENAKSEFLLQLVRPDGDEPELELARNQLLDAEVARARAVNQGTDPTPLENEATEAKRAFFELRRRGTRARSRDFGGDYSIAISELVGGLATDGRVLVHYNLDEGHVVAFWVADSGAARGWIEGDAVDLHELENTVNPWLEGNRGDVRALLTAGAGLASDLSSVLSDVEAKEVVISPWSFLNAIPWGALPMNGSTFGEQYRVSYAPSFAILRQLCKGTRLRRRGMTLIGAERGWLRWGDAEIAAAEALYGQNAYVVQSNTSQSELIHGLGARRMLHIAAHGFWWANDQFATAVWLRRPPELGAFLTAAEVLRDADLRGTELVLLATCDSGRGGTGRRGIERYNGLDGAFLAQGARAVISTMWAVNDFASYLFMTNLHLQLRAGATVAAAFDDSVHLLREGRYQELDESGDLSRALDAGDRRWRETADEIGSGLMSPHYWAPFRLSGAHWLSEPVS